MCNHNFGFKLLTNSAADRPPAAYYCLGECGFHVNFDVDEAGRIRDRHVSCVTVGQEAWRWRLVAYLTEPNPQVQWRVLPKFEQSLK